MTASPDTRHRAGARDAANAWRWLLLIALGMVVLELTVRIEDRITDSASLLSRVAGPNDLVMVDSAGPRGRPNASYRRWHLNALGFRGPPVSPAPAVNTLRVVVSGSSETFGLYEPNGREYPRQLEDSLRVRMATACSAGAPRPVEVLNVALPGMALPSMSVHLDRTVRPLRPQVVVLYPSPGFYLNMTPPRALSRVSSDTTLNSANARKLRVVARLTDQLKALMPESMMTIARRTLTERTMRKYPPGIKYETVPADRLEQFEDDLRSAIGVAKSLGAQVILMGHANATMEPGFEDEALLVSWEYQFPRATGETLARFHQASSDVEARVARDSNVTFVDLPRAFADRWDSAFADFVHFTEAGASVVASTLAPAVIAASRACSETESTR